MAKRLSENSADFKLTTRRLRSALQRHAANDPRLQTAIERYGFPRERRQPHGFSTLVRALAGQQLSVKAAATIYARLVGHFGGQLVPERLVEVRVTTLRKLGLSERKAESLRELARATIQGGLQFDDFWRLPDDVIIEQISSIKGFGIWSAQMYLIFSLSRPDIWPCGDLGVRKGLQSVLGLPQCPTERGMDALGAAFAPERSSLALMCWHAKNSPTL